MRRNYASLLRMVEKFSEFEIDEDELRIGYFKWAKENNVKVPKMIRFLRDSFGNEEGDIVSVVQETSGEIYYNDGLGRYCYLYKADIGKDWDWV